MGLFVLSKATATGWRKHTCVYCGEKFAYRMTRTQQAGVEVGFMADLQTVHEEARQAAESAARKSLQVQFDHVPCVGCGRYQPEMVEQMAKKKYRLLGVAVGLGIGVPGFCSLYSGMSLLDAITPSESDAVSDWLIAWGWLVALVLSLPAICLYRTYRRLVREFDPHDGRDPKEWIPVARRRGVVTAEEYQRLQTAAEQKTSDHGTSSE